MTKFSPSKLLLLVLLLFASLTAVTGASVLAAQNAPTGQPAADGDLLDPSIPPLTGGAPAGPKPSTGSAVAAPREGILFQNAPNAPAINIWYGSTQTFGLKGDPQKWVNIMGNVSSAVPLLSLTYTLNGGPAQPLTIGPNGSRLAQNGDFNIELDYTDLLTGNNAVNITATDQSAGVTQAAVTVNYQGGGTVWTPGAYTINWAAATKVNDVAQVVDGLWTIDNGKARPSVFDFDRLVAIGDISWRDYTVTVPITVNSINTNKSPGIGLIVRWQGHFDAENGVRPYVGWRRLGAMAWYRYEKGTPPTEGLQLLGHRGLELGTKPFVMTPGTTYIYKVSVTSAVGQSKPATYRFKVWNATQPEPAAWDFEKTGIAGEPRNGSILLVAHHADASFGNVTVDLVSTEPKPELTLGTSGTGGGTVTANPQKATYRFGEDVALTAAPNASSTFEGWLGDVSGTANPTSVEMFADRSVNALFVDPTVVTPISDDFNGCDLNHQLWTFVDPLGDATLTMTGGQAKISVPSGAGHDIWSGGRNAPRIMQYADDGNFEFDVKFESPMSQKNQSQGVLVEQDDKKFLRFNFLHDGSSYRIQAYTFVNGEPETAKVNTAITMSAPMYLRVKRVLSGDVWNLFYSPDGITWTLAAGFQFDMSVNAYGAFAGNSSQNPAHDGLIDYFFNKNSPIVPEDNNRKLNVAVNGNGTVERDPTKTNYACDEEVELTAVPAQGFKFGSWSGDLTGTTNPAVLVMNGTKNVTANFVTDVQYTVAVSPNGAGTVTKTPDKPTYGAGEQVTLTAVPALGSLFANWSGDVTSSVNPITVTVNNNMTVVGNFTAAPPRTLTVTPNGNGTVTKNPDKVTYLHGENVTLTAVPGANAAFTGWSGGASGTDNPLVIVMDGDKSITANFADNIHTLAVSIAPAGTGTVTISPQKAAYYDGEIVTLTPVANTGYKFDSWSGGLTGDTAPAQLVMTGNLTVTANFISGETFMVNVSVQGGDGTVTKTPASAEYGYGEEVTLTAIPGAGFEFMNWSGDLTSDTNPAVITVTQEMNIVANFAGEGIYSLTVLPATNGGVDVVPVRDLYAQDQQVMLTAVPETGYVFAGWGNDATGLTNPLTLTMTANITVSAAFDVAPLYTVAVTSNGPGTATVDPAGTQFFAGTIITLTATPQTGYVFTGWSGDVVSNNNPYLLNVNGDKNIVANFAESTPVVSDDFDGCVGVDPMWTWQDALGLADYDTNGRQLSITVPPGGNYETSRKFHKAAQLVQPVANTDFAVLVKLESVLDKQYQFQGIVIRQDDDNLVRVEMSYDNAGLRYSSLSFEDGVGKTRKSQAITQADGDAYMLVRRTGDKFQMYYRDQAAGSWMGMGSFNYSINVQEVGIFAASYGATGTPAPGHTAVFDYFFNELAPIDPEDANAPGLTVTVVGQGAVIREPNVTEYACGQTVSLTANPTQGHRFQNWSGDLNGTSPSLPLVISKKHTVTATFVQLSGFKLYLPAAIR